LGRDSTTTGYLISSREFNSRQLSTVNISSVAVTLVVDFRTTLM
jgi:hypothetical protein